MTKHVGTTLAASARAAAGGGGNPPAPAGAGVGLGLLTHVESGVYWYRGPGCVWGVPGVWERANGFAHTAGVQTIDSKWVGR